MTTELMIKQFQTGEIEFAENSTNWRLRSFALGAAFTPFTFGVGVRDSGELIFNMFDLYRILGVLVVKDGCFDLTPLLSRGYTEDDISTFDHNSYYEFKSVVELCVVEETGLKLLSSLCNYLKSFGLDYFNKWYSNSLKQIKLLNDYSFYRVLGKVVLLDSDFKSENENLCGVTGDLYIIKFSTGVIKVGKSSSGPARIRQHANEAGRYLVKVVDSYIKYGARLGEDLLLDFCKQHGQLFYGKEYFKNLDFNKVKEFLISIK